MPYGDELDARFEALVAQIDEKELRRMRAAAGRGARPSARPRRLLLLAVAAVIAVVAAAVAVLASQPGLLP
ncbi:hypothetical protein AB0C18_03485 [Nonomuraea muscovyensis]|uniref:Ferric-dicitrate binding protein FerR (Iron transport regulator) n=1 Tax=Nonomuraea muscovyensis TaxID=1124761 RepID=A0A7X0EWD2_9ACTN|nr:hypothetical protein [Nonomuraea muscovyensis]MBB6344194.1 ferric-dicitrate binding protein FerR (iron transport regulator) [Nonomuraea muscovyensis]